ncbi:BatD family protein [Sulfurimonas sp. HSL-1716]|uniref:BatD family protein n=1 Tax=Hydrocurvibacter sulfurireducens TaxID=3131937 RepID=UPI0031F81F08
MKNLGKIIIFLIFAANLFAGVTASVDQSVITPGNIVNFSLQVSDTGFEKPDIDTLCGVNILGRSSQTSISGINGKFTKTQTLVYRFSPEKSCTIDPIEIKTDSGVVKTKPIKIDVRPLSADAKAKFSLMYKSDRKEVYAGEPFKVILTSRIRRDMKIIDSKFEPSDMNGFWIKKQQQTDGTYEGDYLQTKVIYILAAQRDGNLTIRPAKMSLAQRGPRDDFWGDMMPRIKWSRYISNRLHVKVKPLPNGIDIVGHDITMDISIDKTKANRNEPVNATVKLTGVANFEDIGSIKPFIPDVSVFEDDAKIEHFIKNGAYSGEYSKKIAFVGDGNFTIPAIQIRYLDTKTNSVKTLKTQPVHIEIAGGAAKKSEEPLKVERSSIEEKAVGVKGAPNISYIYIAFSALAGFVLGILLMLLKPLFRAKKRTVHISSKDTKAILSKLIEFKEDPEVKEMIDILEKKLYSGEDVQIDKNKLKELRKRYGF